jgi:hypothetical protein
MNIPTEAQEQTTLFQWAAMMSGKWPELRLLHAIPNGGSRNPIEARHLKEQGVKAGIPDIFLPCARGEWHGLYIEMKRRKGGRVSDEQREMIRLLIEQGYKAVVCYGWEEAKNVIVEYMKDAATM